MVGLAKVESPAIEGGVAAAGFPQSFVGVVIALLVLLPETLAAVRAARRDRIQTSLNLALGSAMASIGLTIPAIAVASIWLEGPLVLGLGADPDGAAGAHRRGRVAHRGPRAGRPGCRAGCTWCSSPHSCSWRSTPRPRPSSGYIVRAVS